MTPADQPTPCTSHTRPAHPAEGTRVFERDTERTMEYDGRGNWRPVPADLTAWLRRQLDEDERVARAVTAPEWAEGCSWLADLRDPLPSQRRAYGLPKEWRLLTEADTKHIARWDPARVLAEVDAKRRILDWLERLDDWSDSNNAWSMPSITDVWEYMVEPYADREGFREEWRPA